MTAAPTSPVDGSPSPGEVYRVAVEEYRFEVQLNWSRTQYFLTFDAAVLAAAVAVSGTRLSALDFVVGAAAAALSLVALNTQRGYYRAARDRMREVEILVGVPVAQRIATTATSGGRRAPSVTVNRVTQMLFVLLCVAHLVGAVSALLD